MQDPHVHVHGLLSRILWFILEVFVLFFVKRPALRLAVVVYTKQ